MTFVFIATVVVCVTCMLALGAEIERLRKENHKLRMKQ